MNTPNKLTLARVLMVPIFVLLFYWRFPYHYLASLGVFVAASITDAIDGKLARASNQITNFGKFLDPLADKILVMAALACFLEKQQEIISIAAFLLILTREFMVSALRLVVANKGTVVPASFAGKLKTAFTMVAIITALAYMSFRYDFGAFGLEMAGKSDIYCFIGLQVLFWIATILTVWSGIEYLMAYWKDIDPNQ